MVFPFRNLMRKEKKSVLSYKKQDKEIILIPLNVIVSEKRKI